MAASTVTSLYDLAAELLSVSETALATTAAGTPALAYLAPATPVFDCCPALIVNVGALSEEVTSPTAPIAATGQRDRYGRIILATLVVTALRCAPKPLKDGSVTVAANEAATLEVLEDAWALWNGITCAIKNDTFEGLCSYVHIQQSVSIQEQGGCVGWQFTLRAEIGGIPCVESGT